MARISEEKIIGNQEKFDEYFSDYEKIIDNLQTKFTTSENLDFANLVNFKANKSIPKHKWFEYKQGYAEELVKSIECMTNLGKRNMKLSLQTRSSRALPLSDKLHELIGMAIMLDRPSI